MCGCPGVNSKKEEFLSVDLGMSWFWRHLNNPIPPNKETRLTLLEKIED
jgi:hypothetical protein